MRYIYMITMNDLVNEKSIIDDALHNHNFDAFQLKIIEYYAQHREQIIKLLAARLSKNWTWDRISKVDQAVLICAYCEAKAIETDKKIIIDQSLLTIKHYADPQSTAYINAILDKVI